jgi:hypothetical protein
MVSGGRVSVFCRTLCVFDSTNKLGDALSQDWSLVALTGPLSQGRFLPGRASVNICVEEREVFERLAGTGPLSQGRFLPGRTSVNIFRKEHEAFERLAGPGPGALV